MIEERSLRSNTASDDQFTQFVEPEEANIKVTIESDVRQVGKQRLGALMQQFLLMHGYRTVEVTGLCSTDPLRVWSGTEGIVEKQKCVKIHIDVK